MNTTTASYICHGPIVVEWWKEVKDNPAERAALRRCRTVTQVAFIPAFHRLRRDVRAPKVQNLLAVSAALAAHVNEHDPSRSVAQQMAASTGGRSIVSSLRFRRLLEVSDSDELLVHLYRLIRLMKGTINLRNLADSIQRWQGKNHDVQKEWAADYYEHQS